MPALSEFCFKVEKYILILHCISFNLFLILIYYFDLRIKQIIN
jgi:hypothetical protein